MNTTSDILAYLNSNGPATIYQISHSLRLTKADIRFHLKKMLGAKLVTKIDAHYQNGPGRPACQYRIVTKPPVALYQLMIDTLMDQQYEVMQMEELAENIVESLFASFHSNSTSAARLIALERYLEKFGINFRWEASKNGPRIMINREPFSQALKDKKLCDLIVNNLVEVLKENKLA